MQCFITVDITSFTAVALLDAASYRNDCARGALLRLPGPRSTAALRRDSCSRLCTWEGTASNRTVGLIRRLPSSIGCWPSMDSSTRPLTRSGFAAEAGMAACTAGEVACCICGAEWRLRFGAC